MTHQQTMQEAKAILNLNPEEQFEGFLQLFKTVFDISDRKPDVLNERKAMLLARLLARYIDGDKT